MQKCRPSTDKPLLPGCYHAAIVAERTVVIVTRRDELAIAYATALWQWTEVEHEAFAIYLAAIGKVRDDFSALQASYLSVVVAKPRFAMIDAAAQLVWSGQVLDDYNAIKKELHVGNETRNRLAHYVGGDQKLVLPIWKSGDLTKAKAVASGNWTPEKLRAQAIDWGKLQTRIQEFARERFRAQQPSEWAEQQNQSPLTLKAPPPQAQRRKPRCKPL